MVYALNRYQRPPGGDNWFRDSLPSLLFPLVCFSLVAVLPVRWGGNDGDFICLKNVAIGTLAACIIFEGLAPLIGLGSADPNDIIALIAGGIMYTVFSVLAKR